ncbi:response regulator, partial [bacterium]|nr:response regulator [bacterium]
MIETINNPDTALILLVDDSEDIRIQVKHYLASEGYRFIEGTNGQEALTLFEQHHPDLIMLDLAMPGIDGIETCARLRLLPGGEQVPVLVLTAMDDRESIDNAFNAGADEYVNKPVHWPVLRHRIKSLLEVSRGKARLEAIEDLHMLQRIVTACTSTLKLDEILQITLNEALAIAGLEGGSICLKSADDTLHLVAEKGASAETISNLTTNGIKVGECLCGSCAQDMNPLILWNREEVQNYSSRETQIGKDIRFHASFAFVYKEKCVGILCVSTRTDKKPSEKSLKLLETMSAQVALTIENARL